MNRFIAWVLVAVACVGLASAGSAQAQWNDPAVVATLKQIEQDMGDAMVAVDIEKLDRIFADDWTSIGASGTVVTKEKLLRNFKSGVDRLEAFELGPMDVQVKGNVAVVHRSVTEKRTRAGKDVGGEYVWMDLRYDSIDLLDALHPQTLLAYGMNGRDLPVAHGAPLRLRVERQIGYKSMKYLTEVIVTEHLDDGGDRGYAKNGWAWYNGI